MDKKAKQPTLTRKRFLSLLRKASKPISEWQNEKSAKRTLESLPSGGYTETHKSQGKTGDKED